MTLIPTIRAVYYWSDVQRALCDIMEIREDDFRDYHNVVGGDYKDLWHVWINEFAPNIINDSICSFCFGEAEIETPSEAWVQPFYDAIKELKKQLGDPHEIWIHYCW